MHHNDISSTQKKIAKKEYFYPTDAICCWADYSS